MLFGSIDSSNFITVDKPPASLWIMEISGRIFGFSSWSMLVPRAVEGVLAVAQVYATVKRFSGPAAALLAGAAIGFGFLTKMGQAMLVVPAFGLVPHRGPDLTARAAGTSRGRGGRAHRLLRLAGWAGGPCPSGPGIAHRPGPGDVYPLGRLANVSFGAAG
jgi:4-amino-4-deoxy-L-arabinose transferase-like glycosyltransferase